MKPLALRTQSFTVHGKLWTINGERSSNRFVRAKAVKAWRDGAKAVALHPASPPIIPFHHVQIECEAFQKFGVLADPMGHAPVFKAVIDGLVDAQVISGDDGTFVERVTCHPPYRTTGSAYVTVTLTEVA